MSQPYTRRPTVPQPGELDEELDEFWFSNPWYIQQSQNLSAFERNRVFLNGGRGEFFDISFLSGADSDGDGRAVVAADFRNTGQLDLVVRQAGGSPLLLFENQFPLKNWLQVSLRGADGNRLGVGARIKVTANGLTQHRDAFAQNSFTSQTPMRVHFGLANATAVDRVEVIWPNGARQTLTDCPVNRHIVISEMSGYETVTPGRTFAP